MTNKEFSENLEKRTKLFSIEIIKLSAMVNSSPEGRVIRNQITKSATSIGANYREANRSRSKRDFYNKLKICESEASETVYWLEIIKELKWVDDAKIDELIKESSELLAILTSVSNKIRNQL